ncbi:hypothetical protein PBRA_007467 [Plasmodiophora brassicae]|nr:hypothetical protein PBRA_007467 [Plasmodiophora brassicae]
MDERDDAAVEESARRIEAIVQGKLVPMRAHYVQERQRVESRIAEYAKVKAFLEVVAEHALADLDTKVDLGCQFFVNAHVPDTTFVCLDIGFGFHAQMTGAEAVPFIDDKCRLLRDTAARLSAKADGIQAQIDAVRREMERYAIVRQVEEANRSGRLI